MLSFILCLGLGVCSQQWNSNQDTSLPRSLCYETHGHPQISWHCWVMQRTHIINPYLPLSLDRLNLFFSVLSFQIILIPTVCAIKALCIQYHQPWCLAYELGAEWGLTITGWLNKSWCMWRLEIVGKMLSRPPRQSTGNSALLPSPSIHPSWTPDMWASSAHMDSFPVKP